MISRLGRMASNLRKSNNKRFFSEKIDLAIVGGGSGGLACAKTFSDLATEHGLDQE